MPSLNDSEKRRDPEAILKRIHEDEEADEGAAGRGRLKVFFGYAAGVGKTYAMLEEAHRVQDEGVDVVVGYVEPHTRADTLALLEGLVSLPVQTVEHRGVSLREFDLDGALARKPQVVIVDELAHTNAPGCRHRKRYQDVEELLRAGIDVYTTVNVQHLEGVNDRVAAVTSVAVAERVPDRLFDAADSVELVDLEPAELIARLRAGKVYAPERVGWALDHFFSRSNLGALREIALRRAADRLERDRRQSREPQAAGGEDVLVVLAGSGVQTRAVRMAASMAEAAGGALAALVVEAEAEGGAVAPMPAAVKEALDLAEQLGARVVTLSGDDPVQPAALYAVLKDMPGAECRVGPDETLYVVNLIAAEAERILAVTEDGARTAFEYSAACIGSTECQQGIRDSQGLLRSAVAAVREAGIPDGALPKICVSGCPSSCAAHQAGAIGFQGGVRLEDKKPQPAFRLFLGGSDALDTARFGEAGAVILEQDIPSLLVELGRAAAAAGQSWAQWSETHREDLNAIVAKYA